jgi:hypothetical protein
MSMYTGDWQQTGRVRSTSWVNLTHLTSPADYVVRVIAISGLNKSYSDERQFAIGVFKQQGKYFSHFLCPF